MWRRTEKKRRRRREGGDGRNERDRPISPLKPVQNRRFSPALSLSVCLSISNEFSNTNASHHKITFQSQKGQKRERERKGEKTKKCPALPFLLSLLIAFLSPPLHCYPLSPPPSPSVPRGCCRCEPLCHRPAALLRHCSCSGACGRERANKGGSLMDLFVTASPSASASLCSALASPCGTPAWRCALAAGALPPSCS